MKNERLRHLLNAHLDGVLTPDEQLELEQLLLHSAAARTQFWQETRLHHLLTMAEQQAPETPRRPAPLPLTATSDAPSQRRWSMQPDPSEQKPHPHPPTSLWRNPFVAAAAGIVLSALGTSAVWAMAGPRPAFKSHALPLQDPGFESNLHPASTGIPKRFGTWSGDVSRVTEAENGVRPHSGQRMLRFLRADNQTTPPGSVNYVGDMAQVIDLRPYRAELTAGAQINVSAWFCSVPSPENTRFKFAIKAATFQGEVSDAPPLWHASQHESLSAAARHTNPLAETGRWQRVETVLPAPPNADFLVVLLAAIRDLPKPTSKTVEFPGHYVDDLTVSLSPVPPQP